MKKILKIISIILFVFLLGFIGLVTYYLVNPVKSERELFTEVLQRKIGINEVVSIEQIETKLMPLSKQLIIEKYPIFKDRQIEKINILNQDNFIKKVSKELDNPRMIKDKTKQITVDIGQIQAITFCPIAEVYLQYLGKSLTLEEYFHHSVHELLHGMSCDKKSNMVLPLVWEESLTDYFTSNIINKYVGIGSDSITSFPQEVKIIRLLNKFISEDELLNIYITKNILELKNAVDNKFGKGSYDILYNDIEIIYRETDYSYNNTGVNTRVEDAMLRIEKLLTSL